MKRTKIDFFVEQGWTRAAVTWMDRGGPALRKSVSPWSLVPRGGVEEGQTQGSAPTRCGKQSLRPPIRIVPAVALKKG